MPKTGRVRGRVRTCFRFMGRLQYSGCPLYHQTNSLAGKIPSLCCVSTVGHFHTSSALAAVNHNACPSEACSISEILSLRLRLLISHMVSGIKQEYKLKIFRTTFRGGCVALPVSIATGISTKKCSALLLFVRTRNTMRQSSGPPTRPGMSSTLLLSAPYARITYTLQLHLITKPPPGSNLKHNPDNNLQIAPSKIVLRTFFFLSSC
jgi:hypothetical protein